MGVATSRPRQARASTRDRIVRAAARLLHEHGRDGVSTRAVCAAADVQPPTIYRLFGDKQRLLDAVAAHGLTSYLHGMADMELLADPVDDLRAGWDQHVGFGLANPALYPLIYGERRTGVAPPAMLAAGRMVSDKVHRIAEAGRLRVDEDRATQLLQAVCSGVVLWLVALPEEYRDPALADLARDAVIAAITTDAPTWTEPGLVGAAVALRASLPANSVLTTHERHLLQEWLDRVTRS